MDYGEIYPAPQRPGSSTDPRPGEKKKVKKIGKTQRKFARKFKKGKKDDDDEGDDKPDDDDAPGPPGPPPGGSKVKKPTIGKTQKRFSSKKKEQKITTSKPPPDDPKPPPGGAAKAKAKTEDKVIKKILKPKPKAPAAKMPEVVIDSGARSSKDPVLPIRAVPVRTEPKRARKAAPPEEERRRSRRKMVTASYSIA